MKPLETLRSMPSLGIMFTCDRGADCDRCHGCGLVCEAHPYVPAHGNTLVHGGCGCGARGLTCQEARRIPIVVTIRVRGWPHRVMCTQSS